MASVQAPQAPQAPGPDARVMFARLFTSCFQGRHDRTSLPSHKPYSPTEGSSETESGDTSSRHPRLLNFPQPSSTQTRSSPTPPEPVVFLKPPPLPSTKDPDMPKAPRKTTKVAAKSAAKPKQKSKSKYFSSSDIIDENFGTPQPKIDDKLREMFVGMLSQQDIEADDSKNTMGAESLEAYVTSLGVNTVNYELFVLLDTVQAEGLGQITRKGFVDGWTQAAMDRDHRVQPDIESQKKYIRHLIGQVSKDPAYFKKLYQRAFLAGKEPQQKALDKEVAMVFWEMLFDPSVHPWRSKNVNWLDVWKQFLEAKWKRSVNRDMWNQTLIFAGKTTEDETLDFWSEDQAWPGVIDDFVLWCRETGVLSAAKGAEGMEVDE